MARFGCLRTFKRFDLLSKCDQRGGSGLRDRMERCSEALKSRSIARIHWVQLPALRVLISTDLGRFAEYVGRLTGRSLAILL